MNDGVRTARRVGQRFSWNASRFGATRLARRKRTSAVTRLVPTGRVRAGTRSRYMPATLSFVSVLTVLPLSLNVTRTIPRPRTSTIADDPMTHPVVPTARAVPTRDVLLGVVGPDGEDGVAGVVPLVGPDGEVPLPGVSGVVGVVGGVGPVYVFVNVQVTVHGPRSAVATVSGRKRTVVSTPSPPPAVVGVAVQAPHAWSRPAHAAPDAAFAIVQAADVV